MDVNEMLPRVRSFQVNCVPFLRTPLTKKCVPLRGTQKNPVSVELERLPDSWWWQLDSNQRPHRCERCALTKHLYCCTGTMAQLPTYRLTTSPDCFFTRLNCFRTTGNNDGRPFFARLICFRTTDKFGGIPCRICIAILIHIEDRYDDLLHITSEISYQEDIRIIIPRCRVDFINADRG